MRLLIAEEDEALGQFLRRGLETEGYTVRLAMDGGSAVEAFGEDLPDMTIVSLDLPVKVGGQGDGEQVLDELRRTDAELPVMVLSARQEVEARVRCLERGANDVMCKPISLRELRARCRVLLRRRRAARLALRAGDLELDRLDRLARRAGCTVELTGLEFALLEYLMLHRGHCVSRVELLQSVWKLEAVRTTNIVDVYVNYLRGKIRDRRPGTLIRTVRGRGYMVPLEKELANIRSGGAGSVPGSENMSRDFT